MASSLQQKRTTSSSSFFREKQTENNDQVTNLFQNRELFTYFYCSFFILNGIFMPFVFLGVFHVDFIKTKVKIFKMPTPASNP